MDALTKKLLAQLDDAPPAVRNKALEKALEHMAKVQETFRGFVWAIEEGELAKQRVAALETLVQQYKDANDKWLKFFTYYLQAQVVKKWLSDNRQTVAIGIVAVVVGVGAFKTVPAVWAWSSSPADNKAFQLIVQAEPWREGWTHPAVKYVDGRGEYWIVYEGKVDGKNYADEAGKPIEKHCLHLYASPASRIFKDYLRPDAFDWRGAIKWPELGMYCSRAPRPVSGDTEQKISDTPKINPDRLIAAGEAEPPAPKIDAAGLRPAKRKETRQ